MCNYRKDEICTITNKDCPWVYWCDKIQGYKESKDMPKNCPVIEYQEIPDGYYKVLFERRGFLYVQVDNTTIKVANPFDNTPVTVKLYKSKAGEWKVKKIKE